MMSNIFLGFKQWNSQVLELIALVKNATMATNKSPECAVPERLRMMLLAESGLTKNNALCEARVQLQERKQFIRLGL
jgi:hypothetical protein